ncbi:transcription termination factor MTERF9, chloroplastic-like [Aristolochia californica]|uniref:transcription termination factor MTERF9, chloroplastic-like n=1 Tax=Aristolochia californica TaxID=171875 RepID=UPI0035DE37CE
MLHLFVRRLLSFHVLQYQSLKFLKTPASSTPPPLSDSVQYLINTCGLSLKTASAVSEKLRLELENRKTGVSASKKLQLEQQKLRKFVSVLAFLKSQGFSEAHVEDFITGASQVFNVKVDCNLQPKIEFFLYMGLSRSDIARIIVGNPSILRRSLDNYLRPTFSVLTKILHTNDRIMTVFRRWHSLLSFDVIRRVIIPNFAVLVDQGVPSTTISKLMVENPRALIQKRERLVKLVQWAKELGLQPNSSMFVPAILAKVSLSSQNWQKKIKIMKSFGLSEEEVMIAFRRAPFILKRSEEKICKVMYFCVNTMKLEPKVLCSYPTLIMHNFEERTVPRYAVIKVLKSHKLMESETFLWVFTIPEKTFMDRFVTRYLHKVQGLAEVYQQAKLGAMGGRTEGGELGGM